MKEIKNIMNLNLIKNIVNQYQNVIQATTCCTTIAFITYRCYLYYKKSNNNYLNSMNLTTNQLTWDDSTKFPLNNELEDSNITQLKSNNNKRIANLYQKYPIFSKIYTTLPIELSNLLNNIAMAKCLNDLIEPQKKMIVFGIPSLISYDVKLQSWQTHGCFIMNPKEFKNKKSVQRYHQHIKRILSLLPYSMSIKVTPDSIIAIESKLAKFLIEDKKLYFIGDNIDQFWQMIFDKREIKKYNTLLHSNDSYYEHVIKSLRTYITWQEIQILFTWHIIYRYCECFHNDIRKELNDFYGCDFTSSAYGNNSLLSHMYVFEYNQSITVMKNINLDIKKFVQTLDNSKRWTINFSSLNPCFDLQHNKGIIESGLHTNIFRWNNKQDVTCNAHIPTMEYKYVFHGHVLSISLANLQDPMITSDGHITNAFKKRIREICIEKNIE